MAETANILMENGGSSLNWKETELTLGLPGANSGGKISGKRGFSETIDLKLGNGSDLFDKEKSDRDKKNPESTGKSLAARRQVVGWPPVRCYRKNALKSCKYVKVAVDGTPYLRKVDLEIYSSYEELLNGLEKMFSCFTIRNDNQGKLTDSVNGTEYVPTYQDKDGDWMLVGDVPWKIFVESCIRLRLMRCSEAITLAPRTPPNCADS